MQNITGNVIPATADVSLVYRNMYIWLYTDKLHFLETSWIRVIEEIVNVPVIMFAENEWKEIGAVK